KLGFRTSLQADGMSKIWDLLSQLRGTVPPGADLATIRYDNEFVGKATEFFRELERCLFAGASFAAWVLVTDHYSQPRPYVFETESDFVEVLKMIQNLTTGRTDWVFEMMLHERARDLGNLVTLYGQLARFFADLLSERDRFARRPSDLPKYAQHSKIKLFP